MSKRTRTSNQPNRYSIYGTHATMAALANEQRKVHRIWCSQNMLSSIEFDPERHPQPMVTDSKQLQKMLHSYDAVHQGVICEVELLDQPHVEHVLDDDKPLLMLDQVTDPHNIGAIMRSAAAFGVGAVIMPKDGTPRENAVIAKAACGGLEMVPMIQVTNLASTIELIKKSGYWVAGMDGSAEQTIAQAKLGKKSLIVMGAEGKGLRPRTIQSCDYLVKLPMDAQMESLNVSNAAAIALYEIYSKIKYCS